MVDLHGRTTPAMAIQYGQALDPYRPSSSRSPARRRTPRRWPRCSATAMPIATGERLVTRYQFRELFEKAPAP